jgi:transposase
VGSVHGLGAARAARRWSRIRYGFWTSSPGRGDLTLAEIGRRILEELGVKTTEVSIRRFFTRHKISFKKNSARRRTGTASRGRGAAILEGRPGQA